jgi:hypothetical protein
MNEDQKGKSFRISFSFQGGRKMIGLTIHGQGGGKELWWLTNAGGKSWSEIAQYNFELVIGQTGWQSTAVGSFATSDSFTIKNGQTLAVGAGITTAHAPSQGYTDVGLASCCRIKRLLKSCSHFGRTEAVQLGEALAQPFYLRRHRRMFWSHKHSRSKSQLPLMF